MRGTIASTCGLAGIVACASIAWAGDAISMESLLKELSDPLAIARFPDPPFRLFQSSSYDRATKSPDDADGWFANNDAGNFLRVDEHDGRKESVMLDAEGPGAVVRVWTPNPKGVLRIYVDGATTPIIAAPMNEVLDGTTLFGGPKQGFPLAASFSRGWSLFVPIPFAKRCVITTDDGKGVYFQVNWRSYPAGTPVTSARTLAGVAQTSIPDRSRLDATPSTAVRCVKPGETVEVARRDGGGVLLNIGVRPEKPGARMDRLVLSMKTDGEDTAWGPVTEVMLPANTVSRDASKETLLDVDRALAWPMPFRQSISASLTNYGTTDACVFVDTRFGEWKWDDRSMRFHAAWKRDAKLHTRPMRDYRFITVHGKGVFAGDMLHVVNPVDAWWGEGDEKIYVDGESFPSHIGTGTEDYYGYGWCWQDPFVHPLHAQTICDGRGTGDGARTNWGRTIVSRFRGLDAIPFTKDFRFDMEIWHWAECDFAYAPTTYWYAVPGSTSDAKPDVDEAKRGRIDPPPPFKIAGALECESMKIVAKGDGVQAGKQGLRSFAGDTFSGDAHLWVQAKKPGDFIELDVPVADANPVRVTLYATRSWDYGIVQFAIDGTDVGKPVDLYSGERGKVAPTGAIDLGVHRAKNGVLRLRATVVGGNEKSEGAKSFFGLDAVVLSPAP
ncbi:MAG: glycoside hydrolase family 172 protein [Phycisphaerales bacterium]